MSGIKRALEFLSVQMGLDGEITDAVFAEAKRIDLLEEKKLKQPDLNKPVFKIDMFKPVIAEIKKGNCPTCGNAVGDFKDELSKKEFSISGMCQACQDSFFN